jgi:hypothetical protein
MRYVIVGRRLMIALWNNVASCTAIEILSG